MKLIPAYFPLFLAAFLMGCDRFSDAEFTDFVDIGPSGIPEGWNYEFAPSLSDTTKNFTGSYNVVIAVRYSKLCPSKSVIFNIEEISLQHDAPESQMREMTLFDEEGIPVGKGNYGVYEVTDTLRHGYSLPERYSLSISSMLPDSSTIGIKSIGFILNRN